MFYVMAKIFWLVAEPLTVTTTLLMLGLISLAFRRRRLGLAAIVLSTLLLFVACFTTTGLVALQPLEARFARPGAPPVVDTVVVLGGSFDPYVSAARHISELADSGDRFVEAVRLAQIYPQAKILVTGGIGELGGSGDTDAAISQRFFPDMGIARDRLVIEPNSRNTAENAEFTKPLLPSGGIVLLVTSAFHMPRAVGSFRKAGITVIPWPVDYKTTGTVGFGLDIDNPGGNAGALSVAIKEWIGLLSYWLGGKTDALFPQ